MDVFSPSGPELQACRGKGFAAIAALRFVRNLVLVWRRKKKVNTFFHTFFQVFFSGDHGRSLILSPQRQPPRLSRKAGAPCPADAGLGVLDYLGNIIAGGQNAALYGCQRGYRSKPVVTLSSARRSTSEASADEWKEVVNTTNRPLLWGGLSRGGKRFGFMLSFGVWVVGEVAFWIVSSGGARVA
jgi:hypothetical protein